MPMMVHAPLSRTHTDACNAMATMLLRDGVEIASYDSVALERDTAGKMEVCGVHLHVMAVRDIPADSPTAEEPLHHAAGDCWQEVWHSFPGASGQSPVRVI